MASALKKNPGRSWHVLHLLNRALGAASSRKITESNQMGQMGPGSSHHVILSIGQNMVQNPYPKAAEFRTSHLGPGRLAQSIADPKAEAQRQF